MLTGVITRRDRPVDDVGGVEPSAETGFQQHDIGLVLREQTKRRRGLHLENRDRLAGIDLFAVLQHPAQLGIISQAATALFADAEAFVDPHQVWRGIDVDAQACCFERRAQIGDRRAFAVGARDMDHRRQLGFRMIEPRQQAVHAIEAEIDALRMQGRQPRDQFTERPGIGGRQVHAWGAAGTASGVGTICAGSTTCGEGFEAASSAGDLVRIRHSRASVGRISWRCTTMSIMP